DVTWSTENAAVATVDQNGNVTAVGNVGDTTKIVARVGTEYSATCNVTIVNNIVEVTPEEIADNPNKYYGQVVKNYTAGDATYRIFYVDKENKYGDGEYTVYLKADYDYNRRTGLSDYTNYIYEKTKIKEMNPNWAANRGNNESEWNYNEKAAAWLCMPESGENGGLPWSSYYDSSKANYVIGGPSAEMYCDSYNNVEHPEVTNYTLGVQYRVTDYPGYVYTVNGNKSTISNSDYYTGTDTVDYKNYGSMYCGLNGQKGSYYWWLPSPSSNTAVGVCYVYGASAYLTGSSSSFSQTDGGISHIVSLKSDFTIQIER
ncbi:MAG: hypothetical protein HFJ55_07025, partial [Clostridia bacterium]|nr:hypothetical protein [Clostridia bacterium]